MPLKKVKFDEISPTFAAESAARGIEEELALAADLLMPSMGLIGDIVIKKFEKILSPEVKNNVCYCLRSDP